LSTIGVISPSMIVPEPNSLLVERPIAVSYSMIRSGVTFSQIQLAGCEFESLTGYFKRGIRFHIPGYSSVFASADQLDQFSVVSAVTRRDFDEPHTPTVFDWFDNSFLDSPVVVLSCCLLLKGAVVPHA